MSLNLLKYIGLGILGLGGVSSVAALSSRRVREFIGLSSLTYEEDKKWQFLYKMSKKIFYALKSNDKSSLNKSSKDDVIKWLKDKFNSSMESEDDKWENFKSLCEAQKQRETKTGKYVDIHEARLCFLDTHKGNLKEWFSEIYDNSPEISALFRNWDKKNIELWTSFNNKYPKDNPVDKFDKWYDSESDLENIKQVIRMDTSSY